MNLHILHTAPKGPAAGPHFLTEVRTIDPEHDIHLKEFGQLTLRPIRSEDEKAMVEFHQNLSEENIYLRYFEHISLDTRTQHERLTKVCQNTADSFAIVAETHATGTHPARIIGVGRLTTTEVPAVASFALLIQDNALATQLPRDLLKRLITLASVYGFHTLTGELLVADHDILNLCRTLGFTLHTIPEDGLVKVSHSL